MISWSEFGVVTGSVGAVIGLPPRAPSGGGRWSVGRWSIGQTPELAPGVRRPAARTRSETWVVQTCPPAASVDSRWTGTPSSRGQCAGLSLAQHRVGRRDVANRAVALAQLDGEATGHRAHRRGVALDRTGRRRGARCARAATPRRPPQGRARPRARRARRSANCSTASSPATCGQVGQRLLGELGVGAVEARPGPGRSRRSGARAVRDPGRPRRRAVWAAT